MKLLLYLIKENLKLNRKKIGFIIKSLKNLFKLDDFVRNLLEFQRKLRNVYNKPNKFLFITFPSGQLCIEIIL